MHPADVIAARRYWWVAYRANSVVQPHPAIGGAILPLSPEEPMLPHERALPPTRWTKVAIATPIFETKEDAERWIAAWRECHPEVVDLWDKYGPITMTPTQIRDALAMPHRHDDPSTREHFVPLPVVHELAEEFFRLYHDGHQRGPLHAHGPAKEFALHHIGTAPDLTLA